MERVLDDEAPNLKDPGTADPCGAARGTEKVDPCEVDGRGFSKASSYRVAGDQGGCGSSGKATVSPRGFRLVCNNESDWVGG